MKKLMILFICLFIISISPLFSQQAEITGKITNTKNEPVEYANIQLLNADSVFIKGTASDKEGKFKLEATPLKDYLILISALGYDPMKIALNKTKEKTSLENITLRETSVALDEVTVSANRVIQKIDRQINYPSQIALQSSNNALELLYNMALPRVIVNTMQKTISLMDNEKIKLRINNIDANPNQIAALQAKDIIRIDYYDNPGVRVQENAIIDFIVKRKESGGYISTNLNNTPYNGFGEDMVSSKVNYKNSEWSLFYNLSYRNYKKREAQGMTEYFFPDYSITRQEQGIPSPFNYQIHSLNINYNYTISDKRVINVMLSGSIFNNKGYDHSINHYSNDPGIPFPSEINTINKERNPVLDLYYKENISKNQTIYLNLVTGYILSDYKRNNREWNEYNNQESIYKIHTIGNKYSVIGEADHEIRWNKLFLYSGVNYNLGYTRNRYEENNNEKTYLNNSDLYIYSQLQGKIGKLSFNAGIGISYSYFSNQDKGFRFWTFRPSLSLSYPLNKNINLRYIFNATKQNPSLYHLSDVIQETNRFTAFTGNPNLKPYRIYKNQIQVNYNKNKIQCYLGGTHQFYSKVIMEDIFFDEKLSKFIQTQNNQKYLQSISTMGGINWEIISNLLSFNVNGQINWIESKGNNYSHKYISYQGNGQLNLNHKHWKAGLGIGSRYNTLWGETINYGEWWSIIGVGYKFRDLYLGLQVNNFLTDKWSAGNKNLSRLTPGTTWTYIDDSAPIFCLKLSWNFNWGKQSKAEQKKMQNKDSDSGVMKVQ